MSEYELTGKKLDAVHVGSVLKELLDDYEISQSSLALQIGVTYPTLNDLCNEKKNLSTEMALRLARVFEEWGLNFNFWMNIQKQYEQDVKETELSEVLNKIEPYRAEINEELKV